MMKFYWTASLNHRIVMDWDHGSTIRMRPDWDKGNVLTGADVTNSGLQGVREWSRPPERGIMWFTTMAWEVQMPAAESWQKKVVIHYRLEKTWRNKAFTTRKEEYNGLGREHQNHHQFPSEDYTLDKICFIKNGMWDKSHFSGDSPK